MKKEISKKKQLIIAVFIFIAYTTLILVSNIVMDMAESEGNEGLEAVSGLLFGIFTIPVLSIILPMILAGKWKLDYSIWPKRRNTWLALGVALLFGFIISMESIKTVVAAGISLQVFSIHFVSTLLFHTTYYPLLAMLLFPVLEKNFGRLPAVLITSLAFALYHLVQYFFYPAGTTLIIQLFLFGYFTASLVLYLWTESIIIVAVIHQFVASLSLAANGSVHGEPDFLFVITIPIILGLFGFWIVQAIRRKDRVRYNPDWWLECRRRTNRNRNQASGTDC